MTLPQMLDLLGDILDIAHNARYQQAAAEAMRALGG